jgi:signal transduction histidine kinase
MFDKLYTRDKINSLKSGVDNITKIYLEGDLSSTVEEIFSYEIQNMTVCIFSLDTEVGEGEIIYFSRQRYFSTNPFDNEVLRLVERLYNENAFTALQSQKYYIINEESNGPDNKPGNNITVLSHIGDDKYILMETPKKFIKDISSSAIKYSLYISMFSLLLGAIIIYYIAEHTTKPIRQIQTAAEKISNLDFSHKCTVTSKDEIGLLSESINDMAEKLEYSVTQLMAANEKLKEDVVKLEKADKMTKQFIANVSHDFKTPLTLIMSYSEALLDIKDIDGETKNEYLNIIISEGKKMSEFVHELLKLSQLESGMIKLEKSNFSISEIINDTIRKNEIIAEEKNLHIEKNITEESIVYADYFRIEQVFQNLYENAMKYSENGGNIKVTAERNRNKCVIKVYNDGKSISSEDLENIFTSFYRSDKSRKNIGSYGLGLAIVKVIMEMHGEKYGVNNADGGVEFWFELENVDMNSETDFETEDC